MLFQPDQFSVSNPVFVEPDAAMRLAGETILAQHYEAVIGRCLGLQRVGAREVNSKNMKVEAEEGLFLIKHVSAEAISDHEQACVIASRLAGQGAVLTCPQANKNGDFVSRNEQGGWSLWKFVEGDFFSGSDREMDSVAGVVHDVQQHLSHLPDVLWPGKEVSLDAGRILATFNKGDSLRNQWDDIFDAELLSLVREHWPAVMMASKAIEQTASRENASSMVPVHIDLHPHNIMMHGGKVAAILDVDSIVRCSPLAANGFGAFKLFRQHCVHLASDEKDISLRGAFEAFSKALAPEYPPRIALEGARLEVSRRLAYILDGLLAKGKSDWGHVLGIQLSALSEISWLLDEAETV